MENDETDDYKLQIVKDKYLIFKRIHKGWGQLFLAIDFEREIICLIKHISLREIEDKSVFDKLKKEGQTIIDLNNQNIVKIYEIIDKSDDVFIVQEFINSKDLYKCFNHFKENSGEKLFPEKIIQFVIKSLISTVQELHKENIIHRDIKLENIIMEFDKNINDLKQDFKEKEFLRLIKNNLTQDELNNQQSIL